MMDTTRKADLTARMAERLDFMEIAALSVGEASLAVLLRTAAEEARRRSHALEGTRAPIAASKPMRGSCPVHA